MYEKCPRLHAEVRLTVYLRQSLETHSSALPAVGCFLCSLASYLQRQDWVWVDALQAGWRKPVRRNEQSCPTHGELYIAFTMKQI